MKTLIITATILLASTATFATENSKTDCKNIFNGSGVPQEIAQTTSGLPKGTTNSDK